MPWRDMVGLALAGFDMVRTGPHRQGPVGLVPFRWGLVRYGLASQCKVWMGPVWLAHLWPGPASSGMVRYGPSGRQCFMRSVMAWLALAVQCSLWFGLLSRYVHGFCVSWFGQDWLAAIGQRVARCGPKGRFGVRWHGWIRRGSVRFVMVWSGWLRQGFVCFGIHGSAGARQGWARAERPAWLARAC